jgi:hypothetical protein
MSGAPALAFDQFPAMKFWWIVMTLFRVMKNDAGGRRNGPGL